MTSTKLIVAAAALGTAGGFVGGYFYAKKVLQTQYDEAMEKEIEKTKEYYSTFKKPDSPAEIAVQYDGPPAFKIIDEAKDKLVDYRGGSSEPLRDPVLVNGKPIEDVEEVVSRNIFESGDLIDISEEDLKARTTDEPYVITAEEFNTNENEYETASLTYFEGDETVLDAADDPVPDPDSILGEDNYRKFGYGSNDRNLVYIQNDNLEVLFEVVRSTGKAAHEVFGHDFEDDETLKHSHRHGVRKFREYED